MSETQPLNQQTDRNQTDDPGLFQYQNTATSTNNNQHKISRFQEQSGDNSLMESLQTEPQEQQKKNKNKNNYQIAQGYKYPLQHFLEEDRLHYQPDRLYGNYNGDDNHKGDDEFYIIQKVLPNKVTKIMVSDTEDQNGIEGVLIEDEFHNQRNVGTFQPLQFQVKNPASLDKFQNNKKVSQSLKGCTGITIQGTEYLIESMAFFDKEQNPMPYLGDESVENSAGATIGWKHNSKKHRIQKLKEIIEQKKDDDGLGNLKVANEKDSQYGDGSFDSVSEAESDDEQGKEDKKPLESETLEELQKKLEILQSDVPNEDEYFVKIRGRNNGNSITQIEFITNKGQVVKKGQKDIPIPCTKCEGKNNLKPVNFGQSDYNTIAKIEKYKPSELYWDTKGLKCTTETCKRKENLVYQIQQFYHCDCQDKQLRKDYEEKMDDLLKTNSNPSEEDKFNIFTNLQKKMTNDMCKECALELKKRDDYEIEFQSMHSSLQMFHPKDEPVTIRNNTCYSGPSFEEKKTMKVAFIDKPVLNIKKFAFKICQDIDPKQIPGLMIGVGNPDQEIKQKPKKAPRSKADLYKQNSLYELMDQYEVPLDCFDNSEHGYYCISSQMKKYNSTSAEDGGENQSQLQSQQLKQLQKGDVLICEYSSETKALKITVQKFDSKQEDSLQVIKIDLSKEKKIAKIRPCILYSDQDAVIQYTEDLQQLNDESASYPFEICRLLQEQGVERSDSKDLNNYNQILGLNFSLQLGDTGFYTIQYLVDVFFFRDPIPDCNTKSCILHDDEYITNFSMYYDEEALWGISMFTNKRIQTNFGYYSHYYFDIKDEEENGGGDTTQTSNKKLQEGDEEQQNDSKVALKAQNNNENNQLDNVVVKERKFQHVILKQPLDKDNIHIQPHYVKGILAKISKKTNRLVAFNFIFTEQILPSVYKQNLFKLEWNPSKQSTHPDIKILPDGKAECHAKEKKLRFLVAKQPLSNKKKYIFQIKVTTLDPSFMELCIGITQKRWEAKPKKVKYLFEPTTGHQNIQVEENGKRIVLKDNFNTSMLNTTVKKNKNFSKIILLQSSQSIRRGQQQMGKSTRSIKSAGMKTTGQIQVQKQKIYEFTYQVKKMNKNIKQVGIGMCTFQQAENLQYELTDKFDTNKELGYIVFGDGNVLSKNDKLIQSKCEFMFEEGDKIRITYNEKFQEITFVNLTNPKGHKHKIKGIRLEKNQELCPCAILHEKDDSIYLQQSVEYQIQSTLAIDPAELDNIGHGTYMLKANSYVYSNHNEDENNQDSKTTGSFQFKQNDIIEVEVDPILGNITYYNRSQILSTLYRQDFKVVPGKQFYPCCLLASDFTQESVQLITVKEQNQIPLEITNEIDFEYEKSTASKKLENNEDHLGEKLLDTIIMKQSVKNNNTIQMALLKPKLDSSKKYQFTFKIQNLVKDTTQSDKIVLGIARLDRQKKKGYTLKGKDHGCFLISNQGKLYANNNLAQNFQTAQTCFDMENGDMITCILNPNQNQYLIQDKLEKEKINPTIKSKELVLGTLTYTNKRTNQSVIQLIKYSKENPFYIAIGIRDTKCQVKLDQGTDISDDIYEYFSRGKWHAWTVGRGSFNFVTTVVSLVFSLLLGLYDEISDWYYFMKADFGGENRIHRMMFFFLMFQLIVQTISWALLIGGSRKVRSSNNKTVDQEMKGKQGLVEGIKVTLRVMAYNTLWSIIYGITSLHIAVLMTFLIQLKICPFMIHLYMTRYNNVVITNNVQKQMSQELLNDQTNNKQHESKVIRQNVSQPIKFDMNLERNMITFLYYSDISSYIIIMDTIEAIFQAAPMAILQYYNNQENPVEYEGFTAIMIQFGFYSSVVSIMRYAVILISFLFKDKVESMYQIREDALKLKEDAKQFQDVFQIGRSVSVATFNDLLAFSHIAGETYGEIRVIKFNLADNPTHAENIPGLLEIIAKKFKQYGVVIEEKIIDFTGCNIDKDPYLQELNIVLDNLSPNGIKMWGTFDERPKNKRYYEQQLQEIKEQQVNKDAIIEPGTHTVLPLPNPERKTTKKVTRMGNLNQQQHQQQQKKKDDQDNNNNQDKKNSIPTRFKNNLLKSENGEEVIKNRILIIYEYNTDQIIQQKKPDQEKDKNDLDRSFDKSRSSSQNNKDSDNDNSNSDSDGSKSPLLKSSSSKGKMRDILKNSAMFPHKDVSKLLTSIAPISQLAKSKALVKSLQRSKKNKKQANEDDDDEHQKLKENECVLNLTFDDEESFRTTLIYALFTFQHEEYFEAIQNPRIYVDTNYQFMEEKTRQVVEYFAFDKRYAEKTNVTQFIFNQEFKASFVETFSHNIEKWQKLKQYKLFSLKKNKQLTQKELENKKKQQKKQVQDMNASKKDKKNKVPLKGEHYLAQMELSFQDKKEKAKMELQEKKSMYMLDNVAKNNVFFKSLKFLDLRIKITENLGIQTTFLDSYNYFVEQVFKKLRKNHNIEHFHLSFGENVIGTNVEVKQAIEEKYDTSRKQELMDTKKIAVNLGFIAEKVVGKQKSKIQSSIKDDEREKVIEQIEKAIQDWETRIMQVIGVNEFQIDMKNDDILIDQSSNNREITVKEEYEDKDEGKKNIALKNLIFGLMSHHLQPYIEKNEPQEDPKKGRKGKSKSKISPKDEEKMEKQQQEQQLKEQKQKNLSEEEQYTQDEIIYKEEHFSFEIVKQDIYRLMSIGIYKVDEIKHKQFHEQVISKYQKIKKKIKKGVKKGANIQEEDNEESDQDQMQDHQFILEKLSEFGSHQGYMISGNGIAYTSNPEEKSLNGTYAQTQAYLAQFSSKDKSDNLIFPKKSHQQILTAKENGNQKIAIVDLHHGFFKEATYKFSFTILNINPEKKGNIVLGICDKSIKETFKIGVNLYQLEHGCYGISGDGYTFASHDEKQNDKRIGQDAFQFSKNDTVQIEVCLQDKTATFIHKDQDNKLKGQHVMDLPEWKGNNKYTPFCILSDTTDTVQINGEIEQDFSALPDMFYVREGDYTSDQIMHDFKKKAKKLEQDRSKIETYYKERPDYTQKVQDNEKAQDLLKDKKKNYEKENQQLFYAKKNAFQYHTNDKIQIIVNTKDKFIKFINRTNKQIFKMKLAKTIDIFQICGALYNSHDQIRFKPEKYIDKFNSRISHHEDSINISLKTKQEELDDLNGDAYDDCQREITRLSEEFKEIQNEKQNNKVLNKYKSWKEHKLIAEKVIDFSSDALLSLWKQQNELEEKLKEQEDSINDQTTQNLYEQVQDMIEKTIKIKTTQKGKELLLQNLKQKKISADYSNQQMEKMNTDIEQTENRLKIFKQEVKDKFNAIEHDKKQKTKKDLQLADYLQLQKEWDRNLNKFKERKIKELKNEIQNLTQSIYNSTDLITKLSSYIQKYKKLETFNLLFTERSPFYMLNKDEDPQIQIDYYMDFVKTMLSNNPKMKNFTFIMGHHPIKTSVEQGELKAEIEDLDQQLLNEIDPVEKYKIQRKILEKQAKLSELEKFDDEENDYKKKREDAEKLRLLAEQQKNKEQMEERISELQKQLQSQENREKGITNSLKSQNQKLLNQIQTLKKQSQQNKGGKGKQMQGEKVSTGTYDVSLDMIEFKVKDSDNIVRYELYKNDIRKYLLVKENNGKMVPHQKGVIKSIHYNSIKKQITDNFGSAYVQDSKQQPMDYIVEKLKLISTKSKTPFLIDRKDAGIFVPQFDDIVLKDEEGQNVQFSYDKKNLKITVNGEELSSNDMQFDSHTNTLTLRNGSKILIEDKEVLSRIKQMINLTEQKVTFAQDGQVQDLKNLQLSFHDKIGRQVEFVYDNGIVRWFTNGKYEGEVYNLRLKDGAVSVLDQRGGEIKTYSMDQEEIVEKLRLMAELSSMEIQEQFLDLSWVDEKYTLKFQQEQQEQYQTQINDLYHLKKQAKRQMEQEAALENRIRKMKQDIEFFNKKVKQTQNMAENIHSKKQAKEKKDEEKKKREEEKRDKQYFTGPLGQLQDMKVNLAAQKVTQNNMQEKIAQQQIISLQQEVAQLRAYIQKLEKDQTNNNNNMNQTQGSEF